MKILLVANTGWYLYNFRSGLISALVREGWEVVVVTPPDTYQARLESKGIRCVPWGIKRSGMGLGESASVARLFQVYRQEKPDVVHHFTIKSILYGTLAARLAGVPRITNSVTGLGHIFISQRRLARLVRPAIRRWYVWSLSTRNVQSIFQNADDLHILTSPNHRLRRQAIMARGSGVDLERFRPQRPLAERHEKPRVLFVGRLLAEKGIREFVQAARQCHAEGVPAEFEVCGRPDPGNPSSVTAEELADWQTDDALRFLGHIEPVEHAIQEADVVVLPSYREGTPRVLLEAAAMGKAVIASDVPGCRDAMVRDHSGLLVPPRDPAGLADAIKQLVVDPERRRHMGAVGRRYMEQEFDERRVTRQTFQVYRDLLQRQPIQPLDGPQRELKRGAFVMSLDLELAWGTRGRPRAREAVPYLDGTRAAISGLLELLARYDIGATWATVGALLLGQNSGRRHEWLADPQFADVPAGDCRSQPHWYADDIVEQLMECPATQEIGCHTLTHLFVDPSSECRDKLRGELQRFEELLRSYGLPAARSFIFPKAKMAHLDVLSEMGYETFRGPESKWFERLPGERLRAALRLADAVLRRPPCVLLPRRNPVGMWMLPSSQFYSPFMSVGRYVSLEARVRKAVRGLHEAARTRTVFHLWTHPFNLGCRTSELLAGLDAILAEAARLREAGELEILSMSDLGQQLSQQAHTASDLPPPVSVTPQIIEPAASLLTQET